MGLKLDHHARTDPKVAFKQFEAAHGSKVFTYGIGGSDYNPELVFNQVDAALALGRTIFTPMSRLDPDLMMRQINAALP